MLKVLSEGLRRRKISRAVENALAVLVPHMVPPVPRPWVFTVHEQGIGIYYRVNGIQVRHKELLRLRVSGAQERTSHQWLRARRAEIDCHPALAKADLSVILSEIESIYLGHGGSKEVQEAFLLGRAWQKLECLVGCPHDS